MISVCSGTIQAKWIWHWFMIIFTVFWFFLRLYFSCFFAPLYASLFSVTSAYLMHGDYLKWLIWLKDIIDYVVSFCYNVVSRLLICWVCSWHLFNLPICSWVLWNLYTTRKQEFKEHLFCLLWEKQYKKGFQAMSSSAKLDPAFQGAGQRVYPYYE